MKELYQHPKWQKKRLEILERDNWTCLACGDSESPLHVHHFKYTGKPWEAPNEHLHTYCGNCHKLLGRHPKGGIRWVSETGGCDDINFEWSHCPLCGCKKLKSKGSFDKCTNIECGHRIMPVDFPPQIED